MSSIEAINTYNTANMQAALLDQIEGHYTEAKNLLPEIPDHVKIFFSADVIAQEMGVGGYAYDTDIITIGFAEDFSDKELQAKNLRGVVHHEAYHLSQGYNGQIPKLTALQEAIYEGAATVFEREYCGTAVGKYDDKEKMQELLQHIRKLGKEFDWYTWKVYNEELDEHVILYAVGAFIVDTSLAKSGLDIIDIRHKSPEEILALAGLE